MSETIVKIQVPMDKSVRDSLSKIAKLRGFDSLQAYIRFWAKNDVEGRTVEFIDNKEWVQPSDVAVKRLQSQAKKALSDKKSGSIADYSSVSEFMADL